MTKPSETTVENNPIQTTHINCFQIFKINKHERNHLSQLQKSL